MKIYTKTGDAGTTGLIGGQRVSKSSGRIEAYGEVDELNALLGVAAAHCPANSLQKPLTEIQAHLFNLGAQLANPGGGQTGAEVITSKQVDALERQIDAMTHDLPILKSFILPGGTPAAAFLHLARTVCRRAERSIIRLTLKSEQEVDRWVLIYMNRLSDFLFVVARLANQLEGREEVLWNTKTDSTSG